MRAVRALALFVVGWATVAGASPRVLLFPSLGTTARVVVAGRVLMYASTGGSSTLSKNLRRLASSTWEGASVEVRFLGQGVTVTSGHDGNFEASFVAPKGKRWPAGLQTAEAHVSGADPGTATVDVLADDAPFFVISDFDDTVAVTRVLETRALVDSALFKDESTQPPVEGMAAFYGCLRSDKPVRPAFDFVSGSPLQYTGRIAAFLSRNGFPVSGLSMRDLGPGTLKDYKQPVIRELLGRIGVPVVLIGDSGEHDPEVYAQIRDEFPGRVKAIFIRDAGHADDPARFAGMLLFSHPREAAAEAVKLGLASADCVTAAFP